MKRLRLVALQRAGGVAGHVLQERPQPLQQGGADALRQDDGARQAGAQDTEQDLAATPEREFAEQMRVVERRIGDDPGGIAGQHGAVRSGVSQQAGDEGAQRQPRRHCQQERQRVRRQQMHQQYRGPGADQRAGHAKESLRQHHAGERLGDDEHRHDRPLRLVEVQRQRQVQGDQPGRGGAHCEDPVPPGWRPQAAQAGPRTTANEGSKGREHR